MRLRWATVAMLFAAAIGLGGSIEYMSRSYQRELTDKLAQHRLLIAVGVNIRVASEDDCQKLAQALELEKYVCWGLQ